MTSDTPEIRQLLDDEDFAGRLRALASELGRPEQEVRAESIGYLHEMATRHEPAVGEGWRRFSQWSLRAYDLAFDPEQIRRLRKLDRRHSLVVLFSHRSYLDGLVLPAVLNGQGISPAFIMGGSNLNFFPIGGIARRSGVLFVRRSTRELPVYRLTLRSYIGQLIRNRQNLSWSIEGGRTRTGKLRPPVYGILRYVVDAAEAVTGPEVLVQPVSIVYDQLHEVAGMTAEARGGGKTPEGMRWLVHYALQQRIRLGRAYLDFGEPLPLRERLAELRGDSGESAVDPASDSRGDDGHQVERLALDVCHRINQVTPVTATAAVTLAMLAADRALSLDEVLLTVGPLAQYLSSCRWPIAGGANLTDRSTVRRTLQELTSSGVLASYDGGEETVWGICGGQHLVAAFYRNTAIHALVDRAIGEVSTLAATESGANDGGFWQTAWQASLRLRDLLKFEFFFPSRHQYAEYMREELSLIDPQRDWGSPDITAEEAREWLCQAKPLMAHLVLRPFLDAYLVVADQLVCYGDDEFDEREFLDDCLGVARQRALQRRVASEESVSLELFKTAMRLVRNRGLLDADDPHLEKRRRDFAAELAEAVRRVNTIAGMARAQNGNQSAWAG